MDSSDGLLDRFLFKYRTVDSHFARSDYRPENDRDVQLISEGKLFFARRDMLNDEAELRPKVRFSNDGITTPADVERLIQTKLSGQPIAVAEEYRKKWLEEIESPSFAAQWQNRAEGMIDKLLSTIVVCCFCRRPDIPMMWALYAQNYSGYVLGFDSSIPFKTEVNFAGEQKQVPLKARPIVYSDQYPEIDADSLDSTACQETISLNLFGTKGMCWEHEQEIRMGIHNAEPGNRTYPLEMLKMVILGSRMTKPDRAKILGLARTRSNPAIFEARSVPGNFNLTLEPLP